MLWDSADDGEREDNYLSVTWHQSPVIAPSLTSTLSESQVPSPGQGWPMLDRGSDRLQGSVIQANDLITINPDWRQTIDI